MFALEVSRKLLVLLMIQIFLFRAQVQQVLMNLGIQSTRIAEL